MKPHQQRVINEKTELDEIINLLSYFICSSSIFGELDNDEQKRMKRQLNVMAKYSGILAERIAVFK